MVKERESLRVTLKENLMETQQTSPSRSESAQAIQEASRRLSSRVEELSPDVFLAGAAASIALSLFLRVIGKHHDAQFVGQWAPTLLLVGLYTRQGRHLVGSSKQFESGKELVEREMH